MDCRSARVRRVVEAAGLAISSLHSPEAGWDNSNADPAARAASPRQPPTACPAQQRWVVGSSSSTPNKPPTEGQAPFTAKTFADHWARSRESLAYLAEQSRIAGVRIAVENMPARGLPRPGATMGQIIELIHQTWRTP
jgi:sugar phosphate isomerase/epimerase